ncbi:MAG: hypothetical protein F4Z79_08825 [Acidimicrobiia bacterium]|nr:hypothetical protein [Acidimicrobiia bacterium]MXY74923.1 hypothetical protein [Acidimicrobiia bacterium]
MGGATPSRTKSEYWGGDIPWVVPSELTNLPGRYLRTTRESITEIGRKAAGLRVIPPGSVLLTSRASIGSTAITTIPVVTNQGFQNLVAKKGTQGLWLFYCVSAQQRELLRRASGSTFREISRGSVRSLPIVIPPLPEQRAIAAVLDSIDEAIERTEAVITATEQLREAVREELLTRGLPGWHSKWKDARGFGIIPAEWKVNLLRDVTEINRAQWHPIDGSTIFYLDLSSVVAPGRLSPPKEIPAEGAPSRARRLVRSGDILVSTVRPNLRGFARVLQAQENLIASTGFAVLSASPMAEGSFIYHLVMADSFSRYLSNAATGQAYPAVRPTDIGTYRFALPSLPEQEAIGRLLDSIDEAIESLRRKRDALTNVKASTAEALLTGQRRVPVEVER